MLVVITSKTDKSLSVFIIIDDYKAKQYKHIVRLDEQLS
jgi:hypothetical protein